MKIKISKRDSLFYERYEFCVRLLIHYAGAIRDLKFENLQEDLDRVKSRIDYRLNMYSSNHQSHSVYRYTESHQYLSNIVGQLHKMSEYKLVIGYDTLYIYSNNKDKLREVVDNLPHHGRGAFPKMSQARITHTPDTVVLQNSPHRYRSYFKQTVLNHTEREHVRNWLLNQGDAVRLSPGLTAWCNLVKDNARMYGNYFFDHDEPRLLSMLGLVRPGLIKCTKNIVRG